MPALDPKKRLRKLTHHVATAERRLAVALDVASRAKAEIAARRKQLLARRAKLESFQAEHFTEFTEEVEE